MKELNTMQQFTPKKQIYRPDTGVCSYECVINVENLYKQLKLNKNLLFDNYYNLIRNY